MTSSRQHAERFLETYEERDLPWTKPSGAPSALGTDRILFGGGNNNLEVAIAYKMHDHESPRTADLRALWKKRWASRPAPVLLVVLYSDSDGTARVAVCGTTGDPAPILGLPLDQVQRISRAALGEQDRHAAARALDRLLSGAKDHLPTGLVNSGLFALHELREGVPRRSDWPAAGATARQLLGLTGFSLVRALGYETAPRGSAGLLLMHDGVNRAIAVLLNEDELFDRPAARFGAVSPIQHGLHLATQENLPWLIVLRSATIRLYPANPDVGVGRKGQSETYVELDLALLTAEESGYLMLLFSPAALVPNGTVAQILESSANFAADLGARLRDRIFRDVVPRLAIAVATRMNARAENDLEEAYHRTLLILFRLLFLAYAEDRGLLPYGRNPRYDRYAVKTLARDFASDLNQRFDSHAASLWDGMITVWGAVDEGNANWDVPPYNGGLFTRDASTNPSGAALVDMRLNDAEFGPALEALLVDIGEDGTQGPVDFRSLSVREFGTIYEGLLESSLSLAPFNLTVDAKGHYVPAKRDDPIEVIAGSIYFHNRSGQRKSTGSYFTKPFAVEYLLDTAIEPTVAAHLELVAELLDEGDDAAAADMFFDFRIADLAMGSGHFLVAAIDRIEARFSAFLAEHQIPAVNDELNRLARAARTALGDTAAAMEIEPSALLRRQIARRCIYGLDLNLMAVELARLAVWIHTFVPGLPMSALDHSLVVGNSLTGIGTVNEVMEVLDPDHGSGNVSLFADRIREALSVARDRLIRVARTAEATKQEVKEAASAHAKATRDAADVRTLFDAAIAVRLGLIDLPLDPEGAIRSAGIEQVQRKIGELQALHFPVQFPEVFLRDRPGFDCLIGNPPWETVVGKEDAWWSLRFPGLKGLSPGQMTTEITRLRKQRPDLLNELSSDVARLNLYRDALLAGPYPGLGAGHPDLYQAFCWRVWTLIRDDGAVGVVLPRNALAGSGTGTWRSAVFDHGAFADVTMLVNTGGWVFDDVHQQYTVGLVTVRKGDHHSGTVRIRGPFHSLTDFHRGVRQSLVEFAVVEFRTWASHGAFPLLPSAQSAGVFSTLRAHPRLDADSGTWAFRPIQGDFNASADKEQWDQDMTARRGDMPVYKGATIGYGNRITALTSDGPSHARCCPFSRASAPEQRGCLDPRSMALTYRIPTPCRAYTRGSRSAM